MFSDFMKYVTQGEIKFKKELRRFRKEVNAESKKQAIDKVHSLMGSAYGIKRGKVKITSIEEVK